MAWVAVGGAALSIGGSMLAGKGAKGGSIVYGPSQYESAKKNGQGANLDSLMNNNTSYINQNMQRINSGRAPEYAENLIAQQTPYMNDQLKRQFMGRAGDRSGSVMGMGAQNSAMMGLNPKARMSAMNKSFQDYQQGQQQIQQQMNQLRYDSSNQMAMALPGWSTSQQQATGNLMQAGPGIQTPGTPGKYAGLGAAMGSLGGMAFGAGLGGMMGGGAGGASSSSLWGSGAQSGQMGVMNPVNPAAGQSYGPVRTGGYNPSSYGVR